MTDSSWQVPKKLKEVVLWVHPEGRVVGSLFVHFQSLRFPGEQQPFEVINNGKSFVVLRRKSPNEIRFYNRSAIVRVEYEETQGAPPAEGVTAQRCQLHLMDGCMIEGTIMKSMPPGHGRLFDFLNDDRDRFIKIYTDRGRRVCLTNKAYIAFVTPIGEDRG